MKNSIVKRTVTLLLVLVCVLGVLPLSAFAAGGLSSAPGSITQKSNDYMRIGGQFVRYRAASDVINNVGLPFVFNEQVEVPGYGTTRALCAYQIGALDPAANGQKWNFKNEVDNASLKVILTFIYSHTYGDFTDAGNARGLEHWGQYWSDIWFMVAQAMSWYYEHGIILDVNSNREAFIEQASEEFVAAMKLYHQTYGQSSWITNWDNIGTHSIIDSADGGVTGLSAYDYVSTGVNLVLDHPEYFHNYHLWIFEWDNSQPWKLVGQSGVPMQRLLIAVPDPEEPDTDTVKLTVKKLESGTNKPIPGVTFKIESADENNEFSVTRETGLDGTITLTDEADNLKAGQYLITEVEAPEGYVAQTGSQLVTVMPGGAANSVFTFYNTPNKPSEGDGSIRKVDADNPTVGIPGAVIRIISVQLDEGGSFFGEYTTGDGGYIMKEDLDFADLPTGSYLAEEITPPEGYILSSDVSKVKQSFVWDGEHDVSLIFENSAKVKVQLKKVDESGQPLAGAIFLILRDGQIIGTEETGADGTITVSNVSEGYYEFVEVSAPVGFDCDRSPVGAYVNAEDLQGEQIITVTKTNYHKRSLTVEKVDAETGSPVPNTSFHVRGINVAYENDVTTEANGRVTLTDMISGCYEIEETNVPSPWILDTNNRKTVWIDAEQGKDITVTFANNKKPGLMIRKIDQQTGEPLSGVQFRVREVNGSYNELHFTDQNGMIILENMNPGAYTVQETKPKNGWVADDTIHTIYLEENKTTTIELSNLRKPDLFIKKVDSVTGSPISGVKFQVWRASDDTRTGEYNDLGVYYTDASGQIHLERVETGWYKIRELEPAPGYTIKQPDTQEIYLAAGKDHTVTFENTPKNAIIVQKYDSVTGEPLAGCTFQLRYLSGTSGTGGTIIGQKVTGTNGICMWTGLEPGAYIVEEISAADGYSITNSSETVYLADNGEQSVITVIFNNSPDGSLLIRKVCATNPSVTLQNAEFKVTYSDGEFIGDSNGIYRTDENGEIRIEGLKPGKSVVVTETRAPNGFIIDTQSQTIQIKEGRAVILTFKNQPKGSLIIQKRDSQTGEVLPGAEFRVTTAAGCEVGLDGVIGTSTLTSNGIFTTDSQGEIRISNLAPGAYVINEIKAPSGYVIDTPSTNVVIGAGGDTQTVIIKDTKKGGLIVEKYDSVTRQPLAGARFKITMANGEFTADNEGLTSTNGLYTTDINGQIMLSKLLPGTYVVTEDKAPDNYQIDPTPQTVVVNAGDTQTIRFYDDPLCTLTILKRDAVTKKPLKGAEFLVTDSSGRVIGPNNGLYTTGTDGTVTVSGLTPNSTIVVSEKRAPSGYVLDETPKNIVVRPGVANSLIFDDEPGTTLVIRKYIEGTDYEPLAGVAFKVTDGSGAAVGPDDGVYYTDKAGEIVLEGIEPGTTVIAREIKTVEGYVLDGTPQDILIKGGEVQRLTFWNKRAGTLVVQKKDAVTGKLISGAQFQLTYANGGYVDNDNGHLSSNGLYTTDANGEIRISGIIGTVVVKEIQAAPGYVIDAATQTQTVTVNPMDTQTLTFLNEPLCSLIITKLDSVTGKPVPGTVFEVKDGNGNVLGRYTTGSDGAVTVTGLIPGNTYVVTEVKVPDGYVLDSTPKVITVTNGRNTLTGSSSGTGTGSGNGGNSGGTGTGNGNGLTFENDPTVTLIIHKYIEGTNNEPLAGVAFKVTDGSGAAVGPGDGVFYTNGLGEIVIEGLEPGTTVTAREIKTVDGYVLDGTPKTVKITAGSQAPELVFWNAKAGELVIRKLDSVTRQPLAGVEFELTYAGGGYVDNANGHLSSNGLYTTDAHGEIHISGVTGTIVVKETRTIDGYTIDEATRTQTVTVNPMDTQILTFYNAPKQTLTIQKYVDGTTDPIQGVTFLVTDSSGQVVGPNNGEYVTDRNGRIVITDLVPGTTITVKEVRTVSGYVLDTTPQSILIKSGTAQTLTFFNKAEGGLDLIKVSESDTTQRIPGVTFEIRRMDGGLVETVTTGENGRVHVNLDAGNYYAVEIEAAQGFKLDNTPHYFTITDGKTTTLTVKNKPFSGILIHKIDSVTGRGIYGVTFLLYDSGNNPIGQYTSDNQGYVYIENLTKSGRYYLRELENEGYIVDTQMKTVYVTAGETTLVEWKNTPITGQIQITKTSEDYNSVNGWPAGTPIPGTEFEIYHYRTGNLVDTIRTDKNGVAVSRPLPLGRYKIVESKAADFYGLDKTPIEVEIEYAGQIVKAAMTNKSLYTNVSIKKTGYAEVMAGQTIRYTFSEIGNNSTTALTSFYWRDTLPVNAVRLSRIYTGTYNAPGNYKVVYKTNLSNGEYRTMYDNLSTAKNYVLDASPVALGLASNEYVTEFMFVFGVVPANFRQVEAPKVDCTVLSTVTGGSQFTNTADVGGVYNGQWVQAVTRWTTNVYGKPAQLPKTGY